MTDNNVKKENVFLTFLKNVWEEMKDNLLSKWIGCFVGLASVLFMIITLAIYAGMPEMLYNPDVIIYGSIGIVCFVVLSLFKRTSRFAPVFLMLSCVLCLGGFASARDLMDFLTTHFFAGFSMEAFNALPFAFRFSIVALILNIIISSVAMYLPQNRNKKFGVAKRSAVTEGAAEINPPVAEESVTEEDKGENV